MEWFHLLVNIFWGMEFCGPIKSINPYKEEWDRACLKVLRKKTKLQKDCETRWSSTVAMIQKAVVVQKCLPKMRKYCEEKIWAQRPYQIGRKNLENSRADCESIWTNNPCDQVDGRRQISHAIFDSVHVECVGRTNHQNAEGTTTWLRLAHDWSCKRRTSWVVKTLGWVKHWYCYCFDPGSPNQTKRKVGRS